MNKELETLIDKQAIQEVLVRYCRGVDRCDMKMLKSAYWPDATDDHGSFSGNAMAFAEYLIPALKKMSRTMHFIGNVFIELEGQSARVETYCIAHHLSPGDVGLTEDGELTEREMIVGGRYLDRMQKRHGTWRIFERVYVMDWNQNAHSTAQWQGGLYSQLKTRGERYPDDPWYRSSSNHEFESTT